MGLTQSFDRSKTYFPTEGKLSDPFNGEFKLVVDVTITNAPVTEIIAVGFRKPRSNTVWLLGYGEKTYSNDGTETEEWWWNPDSIPTVEEFFINIYPDMKEGETYDYDWVCGILREGESGWLIYLHDTWSTSFTVTKESIVPPVDQNMLIIGGIAAVLGITAVLYVST